MADLTVSDTGLLQDSVLPMPLQNQRFLVLESLLKRLDGLSQYAVVMLVNLAPQSTLAFFADHFSLFGDGWAFAQTDADKRELIKGAIEIHRHKGTPWAIKRTLKLLGYGDSELQERFGYFEHNSVIRHDSNHRYGGEGHWTHYRLMMQTRISRAEAERIKALLTDVAPLRCKLVSINLNNIYHDSTINHDGSHKYDEVIAQW